MLPPFDSKLWPGKLNVPEIWRWSCLTVALHILPSYHVLHYLGSFHLLDVCQIDLQAVALILPSAIFHSRHCFAWLFSLSYEKSLKWCWPRFDRLAVLGYRKHRREIWSLYRDVTLPVLTKPRLDLALEFFAGSLSRLYLSLYIFSLLWI